MERQEKRNLTAAASMYIKAGMYPNAGQVRRSIGEARTLVFWRGIVVYERGRGISTVRISFPL